ncbi:class I SAM-dependent methyltransferase [Nocardia terpenica]|uniref:class I SAM-dependent methyltransferase n=1 Tax=Nocardia terpenica TaxID=455432 RepID=UPI0018934338|nr:methyltransferase domain-containing protein [Nocardia terpenica]MBF6063284.1 class I SAM-dependent methyltransferase [Nocardia terpenica]MBF6105840.1 class I SAM-dependent methyltransferase [Nocardia terpenica]MBF6113576.1 class I SAM-dependent methyltransferase [Nocardia terpenica]MBF6119581.1 class I SAM-dependent methyltransferase [Nocardia terpenica]MBF6151992.1 class I SAM-dependent methyltransferase [Nocardia terpenica]
MTYLSGLAYLLGLEGVALLRGIREGTADKAFVETRIAEIRGLLDAPEFAAAEGVTAVRDGTSTDAVYRAWAPSFDGPNTMFLMEQPPVCAVLDRLPAGDVLDAACGTGRYSAYLTERGHRVVGIDSSAEMLAEARKRLPGINFHQAPVTAIPFPGSAFDTVVCALALRHVPDLRAAMTEFARVLRPGGHLVISDQHLLQSYIKPMTVHRDGGEGPGLLEEYHHSLGEFLTEALPLGFQLRHCEEIDRNRRPSVLDEQPPAPLPTEISWQILHWCPEAAEIAFHLPTVIVLNFQLAEGPTA